MPYVLWQLPFCYLWLYSSCSTRGQIIITSVYHMDTAKAIIADKWVAVYCYRLENGTEIIVPIEEVE